jgi:peroxiredoxin
VKIGLAAVIVVGAAFGFLGRSPDGAGLAEGALAPAFRLERLGGTAFDSSTLRGRLVVLNFWATWCPPCVEEMPSLEGLHRALGREGVRVVAVSVDDDPLALSAFIARHHLTLTVLRDPGAHGVARRYGVEGFPTTFVIGADGLVRGVYVGPAEWDTPGALDHFRKLLGEERPAGRDGLTTAP